MIAIRRENMDSSQRALVPADELGNDDIGVGEYNDGTPGRLASIINYLKERRKIVYGFGAAILVMTCVLIIAICTMKTTVAPVQPTVAPVTTTTTTPVTTTSTTTTPKSTTTVTTPTTTSTTSTTTEPSTTTSTTTKAPMTTTPKPGPAPPVPTVRPLPPHPESLAPKTLLLQVGLKLNFTEVKCIEQHPPVFKYILTIKGVQNAYTGESDKKVNAETGASMMAATDLFGITYNWTVPGPPNPCQESLPKAESMPLPHHSELLPPETLLMQMGLVSNYTQVPCNTSDPQTFKYLLTIQGIAKNYTGESNTPSHAQSAAAMNAATGLFHIAYNYTYPNAEYPCVLE